MIAISIISLILSLAALLLAVFCFIRQNRTEAFLRELPGKLKKAALIAIAGAVAIAFVTKGGKNNDSGN